MVGHFAMSDDIVVDLVERVVQEGAGGVPACLALRQLGLHDVIFAHRRAGAARHLVGRQIEERIDQPAGDPEPDPGEAAE